MKSASHVVRAGLVTYVYQHSKARSVRKLEYPGQGTQISREVVMSGSSAAHEANMYATLSQQSSYLPIEW